MSVKFIYLCRLLIFILVLPITLITILFTFPVYIFTDDAVRPNDIRNGVVYSYGGLKYFWHYYSISGKCIQRIKKSFNGLYNN